MLLFMPHKLQLTLAWTRNTKWPQRRDCATDFIASYCEDSSSNLEVLHLIWPFWHSPHDGQVARSMTGYQWLGSLLGKGLLPSLRLAQSSRKYSSGRSFA